MADQQTLPNKVFCITNIKTYVLLILDLDPLNYDAWRELFTTHCIGFDVIYHIDETSSKPTEPEWKKVDSIVKLWIYGSISQSLLQMVLKKDSTSLQVWNSLETLFRVNKDAKTMQIDSELRNIVMGDLSVTAYCTKIKGLADLIANLDPESSIPDKHLVIYTINGLSSKFDSVANIIRYRSPLPTFVETRSMLLLEEQRMAQSRPVPPSVHTDHPSSPTILNVNHNGGHRRNGRRNDRRQQQGRRRRQPPHVAPPNRYGWVFIPPPNQPRHQQQPLSSPWQRQPSTGLLGPPPQRHQQRQPLPSAATWSPQSPAIGTHLSGPSAHLLEAAPLPPWTWNSLDQATALPELFNTMSLNDPGTSDWYMDTGATDHVHANAGLQDSAPSNPM